MSTTMVSPMARLMPRITAVPMPESAAGQGHAAPGSPMCVAPSAMAGLLELARHGVDGVLSSR